MDYELKKFRKDKTSIIPIEEIYTDLDIKDNDPFDPSLGFRFDTPRRWAQDKSKNKSVGIRDLKLTPSSGDIHCRFVHFLHPCIEGYSATWNTDHYDVDFDDLDVIELGGPNIYITNDIFENITPNNGFEEIITDLLFNKLAGSVWKELYTRRKQYITYSNTHESDRVLYFKHNNNDGYDEIMVKNQKSLPIPSTFSYVYDSNTCKFSVKTNSFLRIIYMSNKTSLLEIDDNGTIHITDEGDVKIEDVLLADEEIAGTTTAYINTPKFCNSELLMITNDITSLKNIYALFNQHFPQKQNTDSTGRIIGYEDDLDKIATILIDRIIYYIPFIHKEGNSFITIDNSPYTSYFCLSDQSAGRTADLTDGIDINNLNLNNVWDRIHLIYHATFAETRGRIIGRNNDHWDSPNKRFIVPGGDQDEFYLKFTTDGKHNILPIGCHFNVDLCFMLNTTNNTATGNQDSFK